MKTLSDFEAAPFSKQQIGGGNDNVVEFHLGHRRTRENVPNEKRYCQSFYLSTYTLFHFQDRIIYQHELHKSNSVS